MPESQTIQHEKPKSPITETFNEKIKSAAVTLKTQKMKFEAVIIKHTQASNCKHNQMLSERIQTTLTESHVNHKTQKPSIQAGMSQTITHPPQNSPAKLREETLEKRGLILINPQFKRLTMRLQKELTKLKEG